MVRTETTKKVLIIKMSKKDPLSKVFSYVFPFRENVEVEDKERFELQTIYPLIRFSCNENRTLEDLCFPHKKALGFHYVSEKESSLGSKNSSNRIMTGGEAVEKS